MVYLLEKFHNLNNSDQENYTGNKLKIDHLHVDVVLKDFAEVQDAKSQWNLGTSKSFCETSRLPYASSPNPKIFSLNILRPKRAEI